MVAVLGSGWWTAFVLVGFALQAGWVALSARLVIYDETYHLQVIEAFSHRLTPIIDQQLTDGPIGDAERYGSWVYHYLMSLPWRALRAVGVDVETRTTVLRLLTVLMVTGALLVFRQLFRELGASSAVANVALLLVAGSPLLVFLAGAVSYDNMLLLVAAGFYLASLRLWKAHVFDPAGWLAVIALGTWGSLTKYTFLPVVAFLGLALIVRQWPYLRHTFVPESASFLRGLPRPTLLRRLALVAGATTGVAIFVERYVVNLIRYRALTPACETIHETALCEMFGPWARNQELRATFEGLSPSLHTLTDYISNQWLPLMFRYTTFIGVMNDDATRAAYGPNIMGAIIAVFIISIVVALVLSWGVIRSITGARVLLAASGFYLVVLLGQNYLDYLDMGVAVGVASRYALLVYPVVVGIVCIGVNRVLSETSTTQGRGLRVALVVGMLVCLTQGGGFLSYLWSAEPDWLRDETSVVGRATTELTNLSRVLILDDEIVYDPRF